MNGGDEPVCCDELELEHQRSLGYECPRREFQDPDDPVCARLVTLGAYEETQARYRLLFDLATAGCSTREKLVIFNRVERAANDEIVRLALFPQKEA